MLLIVSIRLRDVCENIPLVFDQNIDPSFLICISYVRQNDT